MKQFPCQHLADNKSLGETIWLDWRSDFLPLQYRCMQFEKSSGISLDSLRVCDQYIAFNGQKYLCPRYFSIYEIADIPIFGTGMV